MIHQHGAVVSDHSCVAAVFVLGWHGQLIRPLGGHHKSYLQRHENNVQEGDAPNDEVSSLIQHIVFWGQRRNLVTRCVAFLEMTRAN
jgi:hypothetical protein